LKGIDPFFGLKDSEGYFKEGSVVPKNRSGYKILGTWGGDSLEYDKDG